MQHLCEYHSTQGPTWIILAPDTAQCPLCNAEAAVPVQYNLQSCKEMQWRCNAMCRDARRCWREKYWR